MSHSLSSISGSEEDKVAIRRALISVSNKTGIVELCNVLRSFGVELLSTGGTAEALRNANIPVTDVSNFTGFPEILDGRVKTLHPKIHGALLAVRGNPKHDAECAQNGIGAIDLIVMNLYPFEDTVASGVDFDTCVENIDIGGPAMLRSSAKNHKYITVLSSPAQYESFAEDLRNSAHMKNGHGTVTTTLQARRQYAATAFRLSASYDAAIAAHFSKQLPIETAWLGDEGVGGVKGVKEGGEGQSQGEGGGGVSQGKAPQVSEEESSMHISVEQATQEMQGVAMEVCSQGTAESEGSESGEAGVPEGITGTATTTETAPDTTTTTTADPTNTTTTAHTTTDNTGASVLVTRTYKPEFTLKYGCNPHQTPAAVYSILDTNAIPTTIPTTTPSTCSTTPTTAPTTMPTTAGLPFTVLSGVPGYINLLDALYGWQLVCELSTALHNSPAAASYKHCSPAGAAVGVVPLSAQEAQAYEVADPATLTPLALAYLRARNADPMCSFGDFAALSHPVDKCTAMLIKTSICDGVIAPSYEPEALAVLRAKKKGAFIVLQAHRAVTSSEVEYRELCGVAFSQRRNNVVFGEEQLREVVVAGSGLQEGTAMAGTGGGSSHNTAVSTSGVEVLPPAAKRDLILASICVKYTQSNSVGYAVNGQMIGVGAGQQSRVDCVKLAGRKVAVWYLRQHPLVQALPFKKSVKKQDRINARVRYIEGDITPYELPFWEECFEAPPAPLGEIGKAEYLKSLQGVALSSDAFFPFRDSIDHASRYGVQYVAQPGGSIADEEVKEACREYGMAMVFTHLRLFLH